MFMFLFLFFSKLLLCSFFIISSEKWFNYVVTFFCFENAKNLRRSDDANGEKKEDGLVTTNVKFFQSWGRLSRLLEN